MRGRALPLGAVLTALTIAACGGSSTPAHKDPKPKTVSASVIAAAAKKAAAQPGYAFKLTASIDVSQLGGAAGITGSGTLAARRLAGELKLQVSPSGNLGLLGTLQTKAIVTRGHVYLRVPGNLAKLLPGDTPWLSASLDQLAGSAGSGAAVLAQLTPRVALKTLAADSIGTADDLGAATVAGQQTTLYRERLTGSTLATVEVWIAADGLPQQLAVVYDHSRDSGHLTVLFTGYGRQPSPTVPPAAQTGNLTSVLNGITQSGL